MLVPGVVVPMLLCLMRALQKCPFCWHELWEMAYRADECPDLFIRVRRLKCRHTGHPDSVAYDPEKLAIRAGLYCRCAQIRSRWVESSAEFERLDPRRPMARQTVRSVMRESFF